MKMTELFWTIKVRPNLEEELQAVFEGYTFRNGSISRSTSLADNLDHSSNSRVSVLLAFEITNGTWQISWDGLFHFH